jgi:Tfp pilus assembly protein PilZ
VEKRTRDRSKKRLMVRYGLEKAEKTAFTKNLSDSGLHLQTNNVFPPGTMILIEVKMPETTFTMWAKVVWAKRMPAQLAHVLGAGMGVEFIEPDPGWAQAVAEWKAR